MNALESGCDLCGGLGVRSRTAACLMPLIGCRVRYRITFAGRVSRFMARRGDGPLDAGRCQSRLDVLGRDEGGHRWWWGVLLHHGRSGGLTNSVSFAFDFTEQDAAA
jgi:hypothetical protein